MDEIQMEVDVKIAFLGAGKMATAITYGLINNGVMSAADIVATDPSDAARANYTKLTGVPCQTDNPAAVAFADAILLAVKPQSVPDVLPPLREALGGKLLISIAAGIAIRTLQFLVATDRIVRVMPNTPVMVGLGASAYAKTPAVSRADAAFVEKILGSVGIVVELPESQLDAVTGLSGSGPAYVFEFIQAMILGGVESGLDQDTATRLALQTLRGAAEMLHRKFGTPDELRDAVTSPGGTTAAGLAVLREAEFRPLLARVIQRATARSVELGRATHV